VILSLDTWRAAAGLRLQSLFFKDTKKRGVPLELTGIRHEFDTGWRDSNTNYKKGETHKTAAYGFPFLF